VIHVLYALAPALPLGKAGKFVAAAYAVFVAGILVYVAIMAVRARRVERDLDQLERDVAEIQAQRAAAEESERSDSHSGAAL
jgi:type VI protein secretion system component VasK